MGAYFVGLLEFRQRQIGAVLPHQRFAPHLQRIGEVRAFRVGECEFRDGAVVVALAPAASRPNRRRRRGWMALAERRARTSNLRRSNSCAAASISPRLRMHASQSRGVLAISARAFTSPVMAMAVAHRATPDSAASSKAFPVKGGFFTRPSSQSLMVHLSGDHRTPVADPMACQKFCDPTNAETRDRMSIRSRASQTSRASGQIHNGDSREPATIL